MKLIKILLLTLPLLNCASVNKNVPLAFDAAKTESIQEILLPSAGNIHFAGQLKPVAPYPYLKLIFKGERGTALEIAIDEGDGNQQGLDVVLTHTEIWGERLYDYWPMETIPVADMDIAIVWQGSDFSVTINNITRHYKTCISPRQLKTIVHGGSMILKQGTAL